MGFLTKKVVKIDFIDERTQMNRTMLFLYFGEHALERFIINNGMIERNRTPSNWTNYQLADNSRKQSVVLGTEELIR